MFVNPVFITRICILTCATMFCSIAQSEAIQVRKAMYIDLDTQSEVAHNQLSLLKKMDLLGVNFPAHRAEVAVTQDEIAFLQSQGLHVWEMRNRTEKLLESLQGAYLNPDQMEKKLTEINEKFPQLTRKFEIGKTHLGRSITALEISSKPGDTTRPVLLFNALHHAREVMTTEVIMHMSQVLTEQYGKVNEVTNWLDHYRIILVPQVNPDGNTLVHNGQPMWRKNAMSINGNVVGVDLNRNYPTYWNYCNGSSGTSSSQTYRGPSAGSEPETKAMMNLVALTKPVADISYHSYSELIIYPFGCSSAVNPAKNLFYSIGSEMNAGIRNDENQTNQYQLGTAPGLLYEADGTDLDWQWKEQGVIAYTIEINASDFQPDYSAWRDVTVKRQEGGWEAILRRMSHSGFQAHIQTSDAGKVRYSLHQIKNQQSLAFDADAPDRTFALRSSSGLLYQLTEKGVYDISFFVNDALIKTQRVEIADQMVDLGNIFVGP